MCFIGHFWYYVVSPDTPHFPKNAPTPFVRFRYVLYLPTLSHYFPRQFESAHCSWVSIHQSPNFGLS